MSQSPSAAATIVRPPIASLRLIVGGKRIAREKARNRREILGLEPAQVFGEPLDFEQLCRRRATASQISAKPVMSFPGISRRDFEERA